MKVLIQIGYLSLFALGCVFCCYGQEIKPDPLIERQFLVSVIENLDDQTVTINGRSSKALAKIGISDALWTLDSDRSRELLVEALRLTFPQSEEKPTKGKQIAKGLFAPSALEGTHRRLRNRIMRIAARDRRFSNYLVQMLANELGVAERSQVAQDLVNDSIRRGDRDVTTKYVQSAGDTGNFDMNTGQAIYAIAIHDRAAADRLILQTLSRMQNIQMNYQRFRNVIIGLDMAVFGEVSSFLQQQPVPPADISVIRNYLDFQLDKIWEIGLVQPGGFQDVRGSVTSLWPRVSRFTPELTSKWQLLEVQSRINPNDTSLPEPPSAEKQKEFDESLYEKAKNSRKVDDIQLAIKVALGRKDFAKAKELAGLFDDQKLKDAALNQIRAREATFFIDGKQWDDAEKIVITIDDAQLALDSYSALINGLKTRKQDARARNALLDVWRRLGSLDNNPNAIRPLSRIIRIAKDIDSSLAFDLLYEMVKRLDRNPYDKESGEIDFDANSFSSMAMIDFNRSKLAAEMLNDSLRRIIALSAVYKIEAERVSELLKPKPTGK